MCKWDNGSSNAVNVRLESQRRIIECLRSEVRIRRGRHKGSNQDKMIFKENQGKEGGNLCDLYVNFSPFIGNVAWRSEGTMNGSRSKKMGCGA